MNSNNCLLPDLDMAGTVKQSVLGLFYSPMFFLLEWGFLVCLLIENLKISDQYLMDKLNYQVKRS